VDKLYGTYDLEGNHFLDNVDVGGITLKTAYQKQGLLYLLGLLNSKLLRWYFPHVSAPFRGGWLSANRQFLSQLPIRTINFSDPTDKARHDKMVALVEQMLLLHKQLAAAKTPDDKTRIQRQIDATDQQIDQIVYELYGLTEKEIQIVEGGT
jgi:ADP-heptose:LPS heptosyltransferase